MNNARILSIINQSNSNDIKGHIVATQLRAYGFLNISKVIAKRVFNFNTTLTDKEFQLIETEFVDGVVETSNSQLLDSLSYDYCIRVMPRPGVTNNLATSSRVTIEMLLGRSIPEYDCIGTAVEYLISGSGLSNEKLAQFASDYLANELIEEILVFPKDESKNNPFQLRSETNAPLTIDTFDFSDSRVDLDLINQERMLALNSDEIDAIKNYITEDSDNRAKNFVESPGEEKSPGLNIQPRMADFGEKVCGKRWGLSRGELHSPLDFTGRRRALPGCPGMTKNFVALLTDVELEMIAQTWSEHCSHKIFSAHIEYTNRDSGETESIQSLFKTYIARPTLELSKKLDYLQSVFTDNAGMISFNDTYHIVYKVETHNSPSALDPYGGAMTGIVGVNRDPFGTGRGCDLLSNVWGYCLGPPRYKKKIPKGLHHPHRIREGVHKGVIDGGNQSGVPYSRGFEIFDDRYIGKPLVFCGTLGRTPVLINSIPAQEKRHVVGDYIVMVGGRIGKDGLHGATFSSLELTDNVPKQVVQIGDPITQKMMFDFLLEARGMYSGITDNGAGGLASSVGEMSQKTGGCKIDLARAPLKYSGLQPWEILLSESQERMTLAVSKDNWEAFETLAKNRHVEVSRLGEFTNSGYFHATYNDTTVAYISLEFLFSGCPTLQLNAVWEKKQFNEPNIDNISYSLKDILYSVLSNDTISSNASFCRQYDHEVKGLSIIKPLIGPDQDVPSDATVIAIEPGAEEGVALSEGINPFQSDIDTYHMTGNSIDTAIRKLLATGVSLDRVAALDNFCWPDPVKSKKTPDGEYKLAQLVRSCQALRYYCSEFEIPLISGKDSMKNDAVLDDQKISVPPTLLFSVCAKVENINRLRTLAPLSAGDAIYIIGETGDDLGASQLFRTLCDLYNKEKHLWIGNKLPKVDATVARKLYETIQEITRMGLAESLAAIDVGGLAVCLMKMGFASQFGLSINLDTIPKTTNLRPLECLFSESSMRFVATVSKKQENEFIRVLGDFPHACVGTVIEDRIFAVNFEKTPILIESFSDLKQAWNSNE